MSDELDAAAVLSQVIPIGNDHPRVQEFRDAVLEDLAMRPAPAAPLAFTTENGGSLPPLDLHAVLTRITQQLDEVLDILREGRQ